MNRAESLKAIFPPGAWFQFPKKLLKLMSLTEAAILAELISASRVVEAAEKRKGNEWDGWFEYSITPMQEEIGFSEPVQRRVIKSLEDANRLECEQRGYPARRCIRLNLEGLAEELLDLDNDVGLVDRDPPDPIVRADQGSAGSQSLADFADPIKGKDQVLSKDRVITTCIKEVFNNVAGGTCESVTAPSELDEDNPAPVDNGFFPQEDSTTAPSNFDMRCAKELNEGVIRNFKSDRKSQLQNWAAQFRLLRTRDNAPKEQIKKVLVWYLTLDWSEPYIPQAFSGKAFRAKYFDKILPAYLREHDASELEAAEASPAPSSSAQPVLSSSDALRLLQEADAYLDQE